MVVPPDGVAPLETFRRTFVPGCAFSPAFGFCAITFPFVSPDGTGTGVAPNPAAFSSATA